MNQYHMWFNLIDSRRDLEFSRAVDAYLGGLQESGLIASFRLSRRKFGFGPSHLGEWHVVVETQTLEQLDRAFARVAARSGETERAHAAVYGMVKDFQSGLWRDFPDPQGTTPDAAKA